MNQQSQNKIHTKKGILEYITNLGDESLVLFGLLSDLDGLLRQDLLRLLLRFRNSLSIGTNRSKIHTREKQHQ